MKGCEPLDIKEIVNQYLPLINVEINNSDKLEKTILEYSKLRESINRQFNYIYLEEQRNKGSTKETLIDNKVINIIKVLNLKIDKKNFRISILNKLTSLLQ